MSGEKREHLRLPVDTSIFIELVAPGVGSGEDGEIIACRTTNVSRQGLQVSIGREVTVGAILQIGVQMREALEPFYLAGQVEWCNKNEGTAEGWAVGFRLMNADNSDIDSWTSLLIRLDG